MEILTKKNKNADLDGKFVPIVDALGAYQADLTFYDVYKAKNRWQANLLVIINSWSKFIYVYPQKKKDQYETKRNLETWLKTFDDKKKRIERVDLGGVPEQNLETIFPRRLTTDMGKELINSNVRLLLEANDVDLRMINPHLRTEGTAIVERVNRTLREMIEGVMEQEYATETLPAWEERKKVNPKSVMPKKPFNWIDYLPQIVSMYNHTKHASTGIAPADYTVGDFIREFPDQFALMDSRIREIAEKYSPGKLVRFRRFKGQFEKGATPGWSRELYKIVEFLPPITVAICPADVEVEPFTVSRDYNFDVLFVTYRDLLLSSGSAEKKKNYSKYNLNLLRRNKSGDDGDGHLSKELEELAADNIKNPDGDDGYDTLRKQQRRERKLKSLDIPIEDIVTEKRARHPSKKVNSESNLMLRLKEGRKSRGSEEVIMPIPSAEAPDADALETVRRSGRTSNQTTRYKGGYQP